MMISKADNNKMNADYLDLIQRHNETLQLVNTTHSNLQESPDNALLTLRHRQAKSLLNHITRALNQYIEKHIDIELCETGSD